MAISKHPNVTVRLHGLVDGITVCLDQDPVKDRKECFGMTRYMPECSLHFGGNAVQLTTYREE